MEEHQNQPKGEGDWSCQWFIKAIVISDLDNPIEMVCIDVFETIKGKVSDKEVGTVV